ncbi:MAG: DEAD/DEAH box helicase [Promethearchaeota archaeon]
MTLDSVEYFNGAFLKKNLLLYRQYQENIVKQCNNKNSLVVLPTGLGKTIVAILLIIKALEKYPKARIVILAPTRPLVAQHFKSCLRFLEVNEEDVVFFTGKVSPERRINLFLNSQIIISTPQVIKNDVERGRYNLEHVSLLIFDEAHRTKGNYAYNFLATEYINNCQDPLILGLTASPGKDYDHIQELCDNLFIEKVVFKTYTSEDVMKYTYDIDTLLEYVDLPIKFLELSAVWYNLFENYLKFFIERKLIPPNKPYYSKVEFLAISRDITISLKYESGNAIELTEEEYIEALYYKSPKIIDIVRENDLNIQSIFSYCSSCISILHGKDLLETQNISLFKSFLDRLNWKAEQDVKSAKRIMNSDHCKFIVEKLNRDSCEFLQHPKIEKVISIVDEEYGEYKNDKIIIFTQYREMAEKLKHILNEKFKGKLAIEKFIGQSTKIDDSGFSQNKQIDIIDQFRDGLINVLVATSVAEEGLDIPNVDAIIFYESVPSEIRLIQRRGRTGRHSSGRCYIILTRSTVDIPYHKVALRKENTMNRILLNPEQLKLWADLKRKPIDFSQLLTESSKSSSLTNYKERREKEKAILADKTIEEIINEIDNFERSDLYKKYKTIGVTFYSDLVKLDRIKLKNSVSKLKGNKTNIQEQRKRKNYLNKNLKTLVNLAEVYNIEGKIKYTEFQELAKEEEITEQKFYTHFYQACRLGFIKKEGDQVIFLMECD